MHLVSASLEDSIGTYKNLPYYVVILEWSVFNDKGELNVNFPLPPSFSILWYYEEPALYLSVSSIKLFAMKSA